MNSLHFNESERHSVFAFMIQAIDRYYESLDNSAHSTPVQHPSSLKQIRIALASWDFKGSCHPVDVLKFVTQAMENWHLNTAHPSYFGVFNPRSSFMGIAADTLVAAYNPQLASSTSAPFAIEVENHLIRFFAEVFGFSTACEGTFTSGGMEANHTAILAALVHKFPHFMRMGVRSLPAQPVFYVSEESHHSFLKAARLSGLGTHAARFIRVNEDLKMNLELLESQIISDKKEGLLPFMIVGTAGTTSAGVFDSFSELAAQAKRHDLWFHVDAAWGGAAALLPEMNYLFKGVDNADSLTLDAHKWLSVPMGAGMFITQHKDILTQTFDVATPYMPTSSLNHGEDVQTQPYRQSMSWSRRFIGLKLFLSLAVAGKQGYSDTIRHQIKMGKKLREGLISTGWKILNSTELPVVCFVDSKASPQMTVKDTELFASSIAESGRAWVTTTQLGRIPCLRAGIPNFMTQDTHIDSLLMLLNETRRSFYDRAL